MAIQNPRQLHAEIPNMLSADLLQLSKRDIAKALRTAGSSNSIHENAPLRQLLFLEKKAQSGEDHFYYYDHDDDTLRRLKRVDIGTSNKDPVESAIANTFLLDSDIEKVHTVEQRAVNEGQTFEIRRIQWPVAPQAACRDMFLSQPPVKEVNFYIGGSQHFQYTVKSADGGRFRDIIQKFGSVAEADDRIEFLEIDLVGFFQPTHHETEQLEKQGYIQCDAYGQLEIKG